MVFNDFDTITDCGFLPLTTFPTHFGPINGSIIDHIYIKTNIDLSDIHTGIATHRFSHHFPVFTCVPIKNEIVKPPKYINITKNDQASNQHFADEIQNINWNEIFPNEISADACQNYSLFHAKIDALKNKHFPQKKVRFDRHKHKLNPWITNGLLASIKQKDYLYKKYVSISRNNPNFENIKKHFLDYEKN